MTFADGDIPIWPVPPDWSKSVTETLAFGTDVMMPPATGVSQHRSYRPIPRRVFGFDVLANGQARRTAEMLLAGWGGAWRLPIWPDVQWLSASLSSGATSIACDTAGFDFVDGGKALLYADVNDWQVVTIDTVEADHLALSAALAAGTTPGTRLYPLRLARVRGGAEEARFNDGLGRRSLAFDIAEACTWPVLDGVTQYLGHDVLEVRPDESDDPTASVDRLLQTVDYDTALPVVHDLAGVGLRAQQTAWKLFGRAQHTWFRSLLYTRCGRQVPLWLPSFAADLQLADAIAGGSAVLPVEWCGYTLYGLGQHNREDLRIELNDGTVFYRRVTAAAEDGGTENLTIDASLDAGSIAPERVRSIGFMALSVLASDETEIEHVTDADGIAKSTTGWQAVVPDV